MENQKHHGGFMNGFMLGAIVGAAVVFFLFTDKGRKLLKAIVEEGVEDAGELKNLLSEEMDEYEEDYDEPAYSNSEEKLSEAKSPSGGTVTTHERPPASHTDVSHARPKRFFRGIKR